MTLQSTRLRLLLNNSHHLLFHAVPLNAQAFLSVSPALLLSCAFHSALPSVLPCCLNPLPLFGLCYSKPPLLLGNAYISALSVA